MAAPWQALLTCASAVTTMQQQWVHGVNVLVVRDGVETTLPAELWLQQLAAAGLADRPELAGRFLRAQRRPAPGGA